MEDKEIDGFRERFAGKKKETKKKDSKEKKKIEKMEKFEKFALRLRVAKVEEVRQHPDAEKLLVLRIDLGDEKRQLVAGLKEHYKPEELVGKKIVVVCNLKPAICRSSSTTPVLPILSGLPCFFTAS